MTTFPREKLFEFAVAVLKAKGVPEANARVVAESVVRTEAFGVKTHGMTFLSYADGMIPGELDPRAEPVVVRQKGASALVDGNNGFSQLAMRRALAIATRKAGRHGIAMVAVRNALWLGALGPYLIEPARQGFFAELLAQTSTCKDAAPFGGIDARFSTNPVALAFPTDTDPVISDFSTAMMSMGRANQMIRRGEKAGEPAFMDSNGVLGTDPAVIRDGGTLLFLGGPRYGYRGYSLSLWNEAMTALAGGDCNNPEAKTRQTFTLTVIDPRAFAGADAYRREIGRFLAFMKTSRVHPAHDRIRLPGESGFRQLRESESAGIPLEPSLVEIMNKIADKNGVARLG
jgi:L-lactate dehydrogenase